MKVTNTKTKITFTGVSSEPQLSNILNVAESTGCKSEQLDLGTRVVITGDLEKFREAWNLDKGAPKKSDKKSSKKVKPTLTETPQEKLDRLFDEEQKGLKAPTLTEPTFTPLPETLQEAFTNLLEDEVINLEKAKSVLNKVRVLLTEQGFTCKKGFMVEGFVVENDAVFLEVEMENSLETWVFGFEPASMINRGGEGVHVIFNPWNTHDVDSEKAIKLTETLLQIVPDMCICANDDGSWDHNKDSRNFRNGGRFDSWKELFTKEEEGEKDFSSLTRKVKTSEVKKILDLNPELKCRGIITELEKLGFTGLEYEDVYSSIESLNKSKK